MKDKLLAALGLVSIVVLILGIYGYVVNILVLLQDSAGFTTLWVLRIVGIFVMPLGGLMGWIT